MEERDEGLWFELDQETWYLSLRGLKRIVMAFDFLFYDTDIDKATKGATMCPKCRIQC